MPLTQLAPPYPIFTDKNGDPLDAGFLYFGVADLNPETNPIQVYWDSALTQPAAQPIRTTNGYPSRNGSIAAVYTNNYFSVTVRNKRNELVIYAPSGYGVTPGTSASSTDQMVYNEGSTGAVDRVLTALLQDRVSVKDFGAVADGVDTGSAFTGTDNTAAFQAAIDAAGAVGAVLYIPAGKYRFAANTTADSSNLTLNDSIHIIDGYGAELLIDDDAPTTYSVIDFIRTANLDSSTNLDDRELLQINGVTFKGRWSHSNYYPGTNVLTVQNFARIELNDVKAYDIPAKFSRSRYNGSLSIIGFDGQRIASDCIRFIDTPNVEITNINLFEIDDDCIALPVSNAALADSRSRITISNATIEKCEGILILGARVASLSNIAMRLCQGTQIYVGGLVGTEGVAAPHNITLSNITITDPLNRADGGSFGSPPTAMLTSLDAAIIVAGLQPTDGTTAVKPEYYDAVSGAFVTPYQLDTSSNPIMYNYGTSKTLTGGYNVVIDGCTVMRTLPAVTNYSDWGLGLAFSRFGRYDPAVALSNWADNGIQLNGNIKNAVVSDCTVMGLTEGAGVYLRSLASTVAERQREFENILVTGCAVRDCKYGVTHSAVAAGSAFTWSVAVRNCMFDLDPFHTSAARTSPLDGGWQSGLGITARPIGVFFRQCYGWIIHGCSFANCYEAVLANSNFFEQADVKNNIILCEPSVIGFSTSNLGVGTIPYGGDSFAHYIIDGDPTSATYMEISTIPLSESSAIPSSGTYVTGHFVRNRNPTTGTSRTTLGWARQSVGSGHTQASSATADWAPLVVPTS